MKKDSRHLLSYIRKRKCEHIHSRKLTTKTIIHFNYLFEIHITFKSSKISGGVHEALSLGHSKKYGWDSLSA